MPTTSSPGRRLAAAHRRLTGTAVAAFSLTAALWSTAAPRTAVAEEPTDVRALFVTGGGTYDNSIFRFMG